MMRVMILVLYATRGMISNQTRGMGCRAYGARVPRWFPPRRGCSPIRGPADAARCPRTGRGEGRLLQCPAGRASPACRYGERGGVDAGRRQWNTFRVYRNRIREWLANGGRYDRREGDVDAQRYHVGPKGEQGGNYRGNRDRQWCGGGVCGVCEECRVWKGGHAPEPGGGLARSPLPRGLAEIRRGWRSGEECRVMPCQSAVSVVRVSAIRHGDFSCIMY